ncbi:MAG: MFS transporter [Alphaproteobacteria bacterium]|nr:MFS transporter [Alphaproteobacteria bacterium]
MVRPDAALSPARRWLAFVVLLAGAFLPPTDFFIVNVALPSIRDGLGATPSQVALVISGYASGYAVFLVTGGRLGDLYGRKRLFISGMAGFTAASALCGFAPTAGWLVAGRVVQGLAASMLLPQVLGSIRALFDSDRDLARAMTLYGVMMGLASVTGQFGGGALVAWSPFDLGWRTVFLLNLPIGVLAMLAAWPLVPETSATSRPRLDLPGAVLISLVLAAVVVPLSEGREHGWPAWIFLSLAAAPVLLVVFLWHERRLGAQGGMPLVDLDLFAIPSFRRGAIVASLFFFTTAYYLLFGLYNQEGRGTSPLWTGLAILPYGLGLFLGPLSSGWLPARIRPRLLGFGMSIQVVGYILIALCVGLDVTGPTLVLVTFIAGFGQGIAMPRLFNTALQDVPPHQAGLAAGIVNSLLQIGAAVSNAALVSLFFTVLGNGTGAVAYGRALAAAMVTLVLALALACWVAWRR